MQNLLFDTVLQPFGLKKRKGYKSAKCPLCGGKLKIVGEIAVCKKCSFSGTVEELLRKINEVATLQNDSKNSTNKQCIQNCDYLTDKVVFIVCKDPHAEQIFKRINKTGCVAQLSPNLLIKEKILAYVIYTDLTSELEFTKVVNFLLTQTQKVYPVKINVSEEIPESTKEFNEFFKQNLFKHYEKLLFCISKQILHLRADIRNKLIDEFLCLESLSREEKVTVTAYHNLLEAKYEEILNTVFD
ncbi:hypothetical protein [Thermodesulfovibrio yellowstonii]|uniref:hypothetical protein n=1 Tax=Thermodesulfovibrio yellowstonii TaxID=28262 RepID=UPI000401B7F4|nr:hypothetical protein [Thermodesulfovibrio islandicus]